MPPIFFFFFFYNYEELVGKDALCPPLNIESLTPPPSPNLKVAPTRFNFEIHVTATESL